MVVISAMIGDIYQAEFSKFKISHKNMVFSNLHDHHPLCINALTLNHPDSETLELDEQKTSLQEEFPMKY